MAAASALAIMVATPEEALAACAPLAPVASDTVNCDPGVYGPLSWAVDDLTVVVGTGGASASTVAGGASTGIFMSGTSGSLDLSVLHSGSTVGSTVGIGVFLVGSGATVDVDILVEGSISSLGDGVFAYNVGNGGGAISVAVADVTSSNSRGVYALNNSSATTDLTVVSTGTVSGTTGIQVRSAGSGSVSVTSVDVVASLGRGIYAANNAGASDDVTVISTGSIGARSDGVFARGFGTGEVSVSVNNVSSSTRAGVYARNQQGADLSVTASGTVAGQTFGILTTNTGTGATTIIADDVSSVTSNGINAYADASTTGDMTITTTGLVSGGGHGLRTHNRGAGNTIISAYNVTGNSGRGITAYSAASATGDISVTTTVGGTVYGSTDGIFACNKGSGTTTVTTYGTVTGGSGDGIYACSTIITNAAVLGGTNGIVSNHTHADGISITSNDTVTGTLGTGISAYNSGAGTYITIDANAHVSGGVYGIYGFNLGSGALDIDATSVTGGVYGIYAGNGGGSGATDVTVTATGPVVGGIDGIFTTNNVGGGVLDIDAVDVTGSTRKGIYAFLYSATGTDLTINATGTVLGATDGIWAKSYGTGGLSIDASIVTGTLGTGIYARNFGTDLDITTTGTVTGGLHGIVAYNRNSDDLTLDVHDVTGTLGIGVLARNFAGTDELSITSDGLLWGGLDGINAYNWGTGATSIDVAEVTGSTRIGILSRNYGYGTSITASDTITGGQDGIQAYNRGTGNLDIDVVDVYGGTRFGIFTRNDAGDTTITSSVVVEGGTSGIFARGFGYGSISIDAAEVTGTSANGIYAKNYGTSISITSSGVVTGGTHGIQAQNRASGTTTDVTIDASDTVYGGDFGVQVSNKGSGYVNVNVVDVTGQTVDGIEVFNYGTDTTIVATDTVYGGINGIEARNYGSGALTITTVDVEGHSSIGIYARNLGTDITVAATDVDNGGVFVYGGIHGIATVNLGSGDTVISVDDVTGNTGTGILSYQSASGSDLSVVALGTEATPSTVQGQVNGIHVVNLGTGATDVVAVEVTGTTTFGIYARGNGSGSEYHPASIIYDGYGNKMYEVIATKVYHTYGAAVMDGYGNQVLGPYFDLYGDAYIEEDGYGNPVYVLDGYGNQVLNPVTGDPVPVFKLRPAFEITGTTTVNIYGPGYAMLDAYTSYPGVSVSVSGVVQGGTTGIHTINTGTGSTSIFAADTVTGDSARGIYAYNAATALDISIAAQDTVLGDTTGIQSRNLGYGSTTITSTDVSGTNYRGIDAFNSSTTTSLLVHSGEVVNHGNGMFSHVAGTVTGYYDGIYARNFGSGTTMISVIDVTGQNARGIDVYGSATTTDMLISSGTSHFDNTGTFLYSSGQITGATDGIFAVNKGTGSTLVSAFNVTGSNGYGVYVYGAGTTIVDGNGSPVDPAVTVVTTGTVLGSDGGIRVVNMGYGSTVVSAVDVSSSGGIGVFAYGDASTAGMTVNTTGTIYGYTDGIWACGLGSSGTTIHTTGTVTGQTGDGIYSCSTILAENTVYGGVNGINVNHLGTDGVTITAVDVTGGTGNGVDVYNPGTATYVRIADTTTVTGGNDGIEVDNLGTEETTITAEDVYGIAGRAIDVRSSGTYVNIRTYGTTTGLLDGIYARSNGSEGITINSIGTVTGTNYAGIFANANSGTDVAISASDTVTGGLYGIYARNAGSGLVTVDAVDVYSGGTGILTIGYGTDTQITTTGMVEGYNNGISSYNFGSGTTSITAVYAYGITGTGIKFYGGPSATDLSIKATDTVYGGGYGIFVGHNGTGTTTIEVIDVNGTSDVGIYARTYGDLVTLTATGTVYGGMSGAVIFNYGAYGTDIDLVDVTGGSAYGVQAIQYGSDLTIDVTGTTYGGTDGIRVNHSGTGATTINAVDVTGASGYGIYAYTEATSTSLSVITTGSVYGGITGIYACGTGSGGSYVHTYGTVTGQSGTGIFACSTVITEAAVYGGTNGIHVDHVGADGVSVTTNSTVTGASGIGIWAENSAAGTYVDIDANDYVYGGTDGIRTRSLGSGLTAINAIDVTGGSGFGIHAYQFGSSPGLSVTTTGTIIGGTTGIYARTNTGTLSVDTAYVSGGTDNGIRAFSWVHVTDMSVTATDTVIGGTNGILAQNFGQGALTISTVDVIGTSNTGIIARNYATYGTYYGTDISISATGTVTGGSVGISAQNLGTGSTTINAVDVTGTSYRGIDAYNDASTGLLSVITTGTVYGGQDGIWACGLGTGGTYVHAYGTVTGQTGIGIYACSTIIAEDDVYGGTYGILANHMGSDGLTIEAVNVTSASGIGILALNSASGTDIDVTSTGKVDGDSRGIDVRNYGSGTTTIDAVNVYGNNLDAMTVLAYGAGVDISTTGNVVGNFDGMDLRSFGTGSLTVTTNNVTGTNGRGILAVAGNSVSDVTITSTGDTYGGITGVFVFNYGSGAVTINTGWNTYGGTYGIYSASQSGTTINVGAGETVESPGVAAILTTTSPGGNAGDSINTDGIILGNIYTTDGEDTLNFTGGSITGLIDMGDDDDTVNWSDGTLTGQMLGGDDYDTINIALAGGGAWIPTGTGADLIDEFEELNFLSGGWTVDGGNQVGYDLITFNAGVNWISGALVAGELRNNAGSALIVADGSSVSGNMFNGGELEVGLGVTASMDIGGDFTQSGNGVLYADVFGAGDADLLTVGGGVTVHGTLALDQGLAPFVGITTLIDGGISLSGSFDMVTGILPSGLLFSQEIQYEAVDYDVNLVTTLTSASDLDGVNVNQANALDGLVWAVFDPNVSDEMYDFALAVATITDTADLADVGDEIYPGVLDASVAITDGGLRRFQREMMNESRGQGSGGLRMVDDEGHTWWAHTGAAAESMAANQHKFTNYETHALDMSAGVDGFHIGPLTLGAALGYSHGKGSTSTGAPDYTDIRMAMAGAYVRTPLEIVGTGLHGRLDASFSYGTASGTVDRNVEIELLGFDEYFHNNYRANSMVGEVRFNLDGRNGDTWLLRPVVLAGGSVTNTRYDLHRDAGVSNLTIDGSSHERAYIGAGLELYQQWDENKWMMLRSTGMGYFGDNQNIFRSQFGNATSATTFETLGAPLNSVVLFEGGFGYTFGTIFFMGVEGFAEVGDRESTGGSFHVSASF